MPGGPEAPRTGEMANLLIFDRPGTMAAVAAILGDDWHLALAPGETLADHPSDAAAPAVVPASGPPSGPGAVEITALRRQSAQARQVYLALEAGREGEARCWHLARLLDIRGKCRVVLTELTAEGIQSALRRARRIDMRLVDAQAAALALSRLLGEVIDGERGARSGRKRGTDRLHSPVIRLVADRERQIRQFQPQEHYRVDITFHDAAGAAWQAQWDFRNLLPGGPAERIWRDRDTAARVARLRRFQVATCSDREVAEAPPAPFITATLQQDASRRLGLAPWVTMELARALYEKGAITFHHTDSSRISDPAAGAIDRWVAAHPAEARAEGRPASVAPPGPPESAEAIRPTRIEMATAGGTPEEARLYALIRHRTIASRLADAIHLHRELGLTGLDGVPGLVGLRFRAACRSLSRAGWRSYPEASGAGPAPAAGEACPLPDLSPTSLLTSAGGAVHALRTAPPDRFTEAGLIAELAAQGIGRAPTYAAILESIVCRGYVARDGQVLRPTAIGNLIVNALTPAYRLVDLAFQRDLESALDAIASGACGSADVVAAMRRRLTDRGDPGDGSDGLSDRSAPRDIPAPRQAPGLRQFFRRPLLQAFAAR